MGNTDENNEMKKAAYKILPGYNLIIEYYKGIITQEDVIELKKVEVRDELYNPNSNFLIDFRNVQTPLSSGTVPAVNSLNDFFQKLEMQGKAAVLTTSPNHVVLSIAMKELTKNSLKVRTEPFSTLENALRFVECPAESDNIINNILEELDKSTA